MSPTERIVRALEPRRKSIGWFSIVGGVCMMSLLAMISVQEHNNAEKEFERTVRHRKNISRLEDSIRDLITVSDRPFIIYHAGDPAPGDERIVSWPPAAQDLLGWTLEDVQTNGLEIMIPEECRYAHNAALEMTLKAPVDNRKTSIIHCFALTKSGDRVPIRITAWAIGNTTRSIAAIIDRESDIREQKFVPSANSSS